jgi:heavy metal sensor kinase
MNRSIRVRLTFWYLGILTVILGLFSLSLYVVAASNLARDVDKTLALQADAVAESIFAFWRAERAAGAGPGNWATAPAPTFEETVSQVEFPGLVERWEETTGGLNTERAIRLVNMLGHPLGESPSFTQLALPLTEALGTQARRGRAAYETFEGPDGRIRLLTRPVMQASRVLYSVQVATSLQPADASLARLRLWLLILIPLMLGAAGLLSLFLTTTALGPMRRIVDRAQRFIEESLHEDVKLPPTHDELQQLDATLNDMLMRIERAFRRLRQFSAAASHELRTPLTVMKGEIGVTLRKPRTDEEYRQALRTQLSAIDDMAGVVEELLTLAQAEASEGHVERSPVELGALARQAIEVFRAIAQGKAVRIDVSANGPVWVRGNHRLLERLVANLVDNAVKHTPSNGVVTVVMDRRGDEARLTVRDTGPGIPPDELPHLFEQFFMRRSMGDGIHSAGLGLGLCRWIAESHHGHLDVASTPGQGAAFTVRLPVAAPAPQS